jgi:hypothetical protein
LREATVEDIPLIQRCYHRRKAQNMVITLATDEYWRYLIEGWQTPDADPEKDRVYNLLIIVDAGGTPRGFVQTNRRRRSKALLVWNLDVELGTNLQAMVPSLLRALKALGEEMPIAKPDTDPFSTIGFWLGRLHPLYEILGMELAPGKEVPYSWYVRVPDLPAFLKLLAPVLEQRLADSDVAGYTGEIKLDFYRGGLRMAFENGKLSTVENWRPPIFDEGTSGGFPPLIFLQVVFGHRTLDELRHAFPDVWVNNDAEFVIKTLFPTRPSFVWPVF